MNGFVEVANLDVQSEKLRDIFLVAGIVHSSYGFLMPWFLVLAGPVTSPLARLPGGGGGETVL